jgi:hypothetical protein
MGAPIINKNKASKMEVGEIAEQYLIKGTKTIRYKVKLYKGIYSAIPLVNGTPYQVGDKVIVLFEDSLIMDTPFIIGKFNQKKPDEEKLLATIKEIEKPKDPNSIRQETDYSFIQMDSKRKKITISNKNSDSGKIVIDNDQVYIGNTNLTDFLDKMEESFIDNNNNDQIFNSKRDLILNATGAINAISSETIFITTNFTIRSKSEILIETNHLNASASSFEFNVITPKGYDFSIVDAFSFFAVDGDFSINLGKGDFNLTAISPLSEFYFLISPLTPFSGVDSSLAGISVDKTEILIGNTYGLSQLSLSSDSFESKIFYGLSSIKMSSSSISANLSFGAVKMELSPTSFSVTISGNKMTLSSSGLTVTTGNIVATAGDVKGGAYSLMKHKHPTAVPGGPSPPLPG